MKSNSYKPIPECCNQNNVDCQYLGQNLAEPCWGEVSMDAVDCGEEGLIPVHACKGHYGVCDGSKYTKEIT